MNEIIRLSKELSQEEREKTIKQLKLIQDGVTKETISYLPYDKRNFYFLLNYIYSSTYRVDIFEYMFDEWNKFLKEMNEGEIIVESKYSSYTDGHIKIILGKSERHNFEYSDRNIEVLQKQEFISRFYYSFPRDWHSPNTCDVSIITKGKEIKLQEFLLTLLHDSYSKFYRQDK